MTKRDRKAELARRGVTLASIARQLGVTVQTVSQVNIGRDRSQRVEQAIADALGVPVSEAFPPTAPDTATT